MMGMVEQSGQESPDDEERRRDFARGTPRRLTLCFSLSSLLNGALMMVRRTLEGALKCALRDFRREEWRAEEDRIDQS